MFSFPAFGNRVEISLSGSLWWSFKFSVCLEFLFTKIIWDENKIGNSGFLGWLSSLRIAVEHADLTTQLSHPPWLPNYLTLSDTLKMSPMVSDVSVVYLRAGSAYVLIWTSCIAWAFISQLPFISNKCWGKGEGNTEEHHPWCRWTRVPGQLTPGHRCYCENRGRVSLGGYSRGLQSLLREMLSVRQGEEPVWQLHHPSQLCRQQGVTPVKESSCRRIELMMDRPTLMMRGGCGCPWQ